MRKKELIQMHALLLEVAHYLIETEDMPAEKLSAYHALGISPLSVHRSKRDHYEAITVLVDALNGWLDPERMSSVIR